MIQPRVGRARPGADGRPAPPVNHSEGPTAAISTGSRGLGPGLDRAPPRPGPRRRDVAEDPRDHV